MLLRRDEHEATIQAQTKQAIHRRQKELATALTCPITLVHGLMDSDVSYENSIELSKLFVGSESAEVLLLCDGDHRLNSWADAGRLNSLVMLMILRLRSSREEDYDQAQM